MPACNYTFSYEVFTLEQDFSRSWNEITFERLREFDPLLNEIYVNFDSEERGLEFTITSPEQIEKTFEVYIAGALENYDSPSSVDSNTRMEAFLTPFNVVVKEDYYSLFNTAPTINLIPPKVEMYSGASTIVFIQKPIDFENNTVWLDDWDIRSGSAGQRSTYNSWIDFRNSSAVENINITISVPVDEPSTSFSIVLIFKDNHIRDPA